VTSPSPLTGHPELQYHLFRGQPSLWHRDSPDSPGSTHTQLTEGPIWPCPGQCRLRNVAFTVGDQACTNYGSPWPKPHSCSPPVHEPWTLSS
jgi:hypothetical protein